MADSLYENLKQHLQNDDPVALATVIDGPADLLGASMLVQPDGTVLYADQRGAISPLPSDEWAGRVRATAQAALARAEANAAVVDFESEQGSISCFIDVLAPAPHLIIIGGVHIGMVLCRLAKELGYRVTVIDARPPFVTPERFPLADEIIVAWPDDGLNRLRITPQTAVAVLTHDPKFDEPALKTVLNTPAGYVGAIGSRKTRREHSDHLRAQGVSDEALQRVHGPIGLEIGAQTPEEIALSIMAEIVAVRRGRVSLGFGKRNDLTTGAESRQSDAPIPEMESRQRNEPAPETENRQSNGPATGMAPGINDEPAIKTGTGKVVADRSA